MNKFKKEVMLAVVFLFLINAGFALDDSDVALTYSRGDITVSINGGRSDEYFNQLQFYNDLAPSGLKPPTPDGFLSTYTLCGAASCFGDVDFTIGFTEIKIYKPGTYYVVVHDLGEEEERNIIKEFYVDAIDLFGCDYNTTFIPNKRCVVDITGNEKDRPLYCDQGELISNACGICGCSSGTICCPDPGYQCKFKEGFCIEPVKAEIAETPIPPVEWILEEAFCNAVVDFEEFSIPNGNCVNGIITTMPFSNDLFSSMCQCKLLDLDLDNDGFNSTDYYEGTDCNDIDALINPDSFEICGNNIDEDCDGRFNNNCEGVCDTDKDDHEEYSYCIGPKPNDDCDDDDFEVNPIRLERCDNKDNDCDGAVDEGFDNLIEICGNNIDENCDGQIDEGCICKEVVENGVKLLDEIPGLCSNGLRECVEGKEWKIISRPNNGINGNCPLVTYADQEEGNIIEFENGEVIKMSLTYVCTNPSGCNDVTVRIN